MQLTLDRATLEKPHKRAASAARIAGSIDDESIAPLAEDVDTIAHELGELLGEPRRTATVAERVDNLRLLVAKADALASATESLLEHVIWVEDGDERRRLEHLAHLVGATAETAQAAMEECDELAVEVAQTQPAG